MAVVVCVLALWSAGPAQANSPLAGVTAPVTAVQQTTTAPVVTAVQQSTSEPTSSPRRAAARVRQVRAAAAHRVAPQPQPAAPTTAPSAAPTNAVVTASTAVASRSKAAAERGAKVVASRSKAAADRGAKAVATRSKAADRASKTVAAVRDRAPRIVAALTAAPQRTVAALRTAPRRTVVALQTFSSQLHGVAADTPALAGALDAFDPAAQSSSLRDTAPTTGRGVLTSRGGARPAIASSSPRLQAIVGTVGPGTVATSGWRNAASVVVDRVDGTLAGLDAPTSQPAGAASAATSMAGTAAVALLGLLGLLSLISQRQGAIVRLRSAFAPASPFLALPERPG